MLILTNTRNYEVHVMILWGCSVIMLVPMDAEICQLKHGLRNNSKHVNVPRKQEFHFPTNRCRHFLRLLNNNEPRDSSSLLVPLN